MVFWRLFVTSCRGNTSVCIKEGVFSHLGSGCSFIAEGAAAVAIVTG